MSARHQYRSLNIVSPIRRRGRPRRVDIERQAQELLHGGSPNAATNTTARRHTGRKNVMRSCERRANLEADEWTCEVLADGVRCGGCGRWYTIDARARFYSSHWLKHRGRCKGIKVKTGQPIPPRKPPTRKLKQNAASSQSLPMSDSSSSNYSLSSSGAADSGASQGASVSSAAEYSCHGTQRQLRPSPVDVMFPNGSTMLLPWSIHDDQHFPTTLLPPKRAQGTVRDFIHDAPRFQARESCSTPRSKSPQAVILPAFDHGREPAARSIYSYSYRDTPSPLPSTPTNPPQAIRGRRETMRMHQEYSCSSDSEMSSGPRSVAHAPSPTISYTMAPSSPSGYSHSGYCKVPSGYSYPHFDAPPSPMPYGDGRRLPPIITLGEYQASRIRQRTGPSPAPRSRSAQLAKPPTFSHGHGQVPGTWNISDYRYPSSPPLFTPSSLQRATYGGFAAEGNCSQVGEIQLAGPSHRSLSHSEGSETSSDSAISVQSPEISHASGQEVYRMDDSNDGWSDPFSRPQYHRIFTPRSQRHETTSSYSDGHQSEYTSPESTISSALPSLGGRRGIVQGHASQATGERCRRLQMTGPGIYGGRGDGRGMERLILGYRSEQTPRRMNLEHVNPVTDEYRGAVAFENDAQWESETSEWQRGRYRRASRYELEGWFGSGM